MSASKFLKRKCLEVLDLLDEHIPYYYVKLVQIELKKNGFSRTTNQIISVRNGHTYDIEVIKALAIIANIKVDILIEEEMSELEEKINAL